MNNLDIASKPISIYDSPIGDIRTMPETSVKNIIDLLTISQAANRVGCDVSTLHRAVVNGKVENALKIGTHWFVFLPDVEKWWTRNKHPGGRPKKIT